jgi:hypothetical protein
MLFEFLLYLWAVASGILGILGAVSTVVWGISFVPWFAKRFRVEDHPVIWKYGPLIVALALFTASSFGTYREQRLGFESAKRELADRDNAEGYFVPSIRAGRTKNELFSFLTLENASPSKAITVLVENASLQVDAEPIGSLRSAEMESIAPLRESYLELPKAVIAASPNNERAIKLSVMVRARYSFVSSERDFLLCKRLECDFPSSQQEGQIRGLFCSKQACK